jgi:hypothetical protein
MKRQKQIKNDSGQFPRMQTPENNALLSFLYHAEMWCKRKKFHVEETPGHVDFGLLLVIVEIVCMVMMWLLR